MGRVYWGKCATVVGALEVIANFVRFNLHRELAIELVARKFSEG